MQRGGRGGSEGYIFDGGQKQAEQRRMDGFLGSKLFENMVDDSAGIRAKQRSDRPAVEEDLPKRLRLCHAFESCS